MVGVAVRSRESVDHPSATELINDAAHVLLDGFTPLSGGKLRKSLLRDVRELQARGIKVALLGA